MEETGDKLNANKIYLELAKERHYYGFLAAARIGAPVSLEKDPVKATQTQITTLLERDDVKRAYEFLQLGRDVDAAASGITYSVTSTVRHLRPPRDSQ